MGILRFIYEYFTGTIVHYAPPVDDDMVFEMVVNCCAVDEDGHVTLGFKTPRQLEVENRDFFADVMMDIHELPVADYILGD